MYDNEAKNKNNKKSNANSPIKKKEKTVKTSTISKRFSDPDGDEDDLLISEITKEEWPKNPIDSSRM